MITSVHPPMLTQLPPDAVEPVWNTAADLDHSCGPFGTYAWFRSWSGILETDTTPLLFQFGPVLYPLMRRGDALLLAGNHEVADYMDAVGPDQDKPAGWQAVMDYARTQGIRELTLHNVPESSATCRFFSTNSATPGITVNVEPEDTTPRLALPADWEAFTATLDRKDRHELRRKIRKFEREHPTATLTVSSHPQQDLERIMDLMKLDPAKRTFLTPQMTEFFRSLPRQMEHSVRLLLVQADDQLAAGLICFVTNATLYLYNSGFDETGFSGAGFYSKALSLRYAITERCTEYNFLQGNERYKYELGGKDFAVVKISVTFR